MKKNVKEISNDARFARLEDMVRYITESQKNLEILYYGLSEQIKLLAEGLSMTNETLERFKEHVEGRFNNTDRSLNKIIMNDSPSRPELEVVRKQVRKLNDKVFK